MRILEQQSVQSLSQIVEESTRSTKEGVKYFIEPALNTLSRAKSKRHHIIFGRRGSGKSSLLAKVAADFTIDRTPIAYVDLEKFKGHSYPDVLVSILIEALSEFRKWLVGPGVEPRSKKSFWKKLTGIVPDKKGLEKNSISSVVQKIDKEIAELNDVLFSGDEAKRKKTSSAGHTNKLKGEASGGQKNILALGGSYERNDDRNTEVVEEYSSTKIEFLHRKILTLKSIFSELGMAANGPAYLLFDDLYHIRIKDQANVLDYFHRIAKGSNLWLKVGTIRHRSRWYIHGHPPVGLKLGDDADSIDLDVTLEKYDLTKRFLIKILDQFTRELSLRLEDIMTDGARDRLVLASGGVARDFLSIFRRAIDMALERFARNELARGDKIGAEDVNRAAGEYDPFKREDFNRDTGSDERELLLSTFDQISDFCLNISKANCFLVEKDLKTSEAELVAELVDLKFLHHIKSRVTVRDRSNRLYDAYMLDLSQYAGERARRNFEIVEFWGSQTDDALRKTRLIFLDRDG